MSTQGTDTSMGTMTDATLISPGHARFAKPRERGGLEPIIALAVAVVFSVITYMVFKLTLPAPGNAPSFVHQKFHFPVGEFVLAQNLDFVITMSTTFLFWWVIGIAMMRMQIGRASCRERV